MFEYNAENAEIDGCRAFEMGEPRVVPLRWAGVKATWLKGYDDMEAHSDAESLGYASVGDMAAAVKELNRPYIDEEE